MKKDTERVKNVIALIDLCEGREEVNIETKRVKLSQIKLNPDNPRRISEKDMERLVKSLTEFPEMMDIREIVVDENMMVMGGNMRTLALKKAGAKECVAKIVTGLTPEQKREFVIKDNSAFGSWDMDALANGWDDLPLADWGVDLPEDWAGSSEDQETQDAEPQIDKAAELNKAWQVKPGDLWQIGEHRLLCGDSTKAEDVERVMGGEKADMVFTDPPYNVASENGIYAADCSKAMADLKKAEWDHDFQLLPALEAIPMAQDVTVYVCTSHHLAPLIWEWMREWADHSSWCVWNKPNPMPSLSKRHWTWNGELIAYATRGKHTFNFPKEGHALSVWTITKKSDGSHPTQKPIEVPAEGIAHSSKNGDLIFDGFLGSGTTMVACQNLSRKCRGIEISEDYCAVILQRMTDAFPGIEIRRINA